MKLFIGESNYSLIKIPPGIWNGVKGIGVRPAYLSRQQLADYIATALQANLEWAKT